jgi:hypothetical protein
MHDETATPAGQSASSRSERAEALPLPGGRDVRRALRIYVAGRSRFWSADEKRAAAGEGPAPSEPDSSEIADSERDARVRVPVPETLQFHRAAGTWRDGVPGGRRRPSGSRID